MKSTKSQYSSKVRKEAYPGTDGFLQPRHQSKSPMLCLHPSPTGMTSASL